VVTLSPSSLYFYRVNGHEESLNTMGMISGLLSSSYSLGSAIGPLMSGFVTDRYGFEWSITIMAFTILGMVRSLFSII